MKRLVLFCTFVLGLPLLLAACGGTSPTTVLVTETEFKIDSSETSFSPGTPYHFVVTNRGMIVHDFMIMPKSEGSMSEMPMEDLDKKALASISNLNPGETKTLDYTFPSTATGSHPEFACYYPGHYEAGMKLDVAVGK